jgi:hypothetical protein
MIDPDKKRASDKRYRERLKADPLRTRKRRERAKRLKTKYRRIAGARDREQMAKRAAIKRLILCLRRRALSLHRLQQRATSKQREARRKRKRYNEDPKNAVYHRMKRSIHKHLRNNTASRNWSKHLGYTMQELHAHIERQFIAGMSWHNMGQWHIDHIVPVASFTFNSVDDAEFRACYALTNLRPMWGADNIRKRDIRTHLL